MARFRARRPGLRGVCPAGDRPPRGDAARGARGANRRRSGARAPRRAGRRARRVGRAASAPGAPALPADARSLPLGAAGRGARGLPRGPARTVGGAWPGAERAAQATRAGDPAPGSGPGSRAERTGAWSSQPRSARPLNPRRPECHGCARRPDRPREASGSRRPRARADRGRGRGGRGASRRHGRTRIAQGGAAGGWRRREDSRLLIAYPRCGRHAARRAGGRRSARDRLPWPAVGSGDGGCPRAGAL